MLDNIFGYRVTQEMTPLGGKSAPVQPPSYADMPAAVSTASDGSKSVILNGIAAEAHAMSAEMLRVLGDDAPGIFVEVPSQELIRKVAAAEYKKLADTHGVSLETYTDFLTSSLESAEVNSWNTSHRHADAALRYAASVENPDIQIWADNNPSPIGDLIRTAGNGMALAENFPNSVILGYWLATRTPHQTRVARCLRSIITGWGATEVVNSSMKNNPFLAQLPVEGNSMALKNGSVSRINKSGEAHKPSNYGFGSVPGSGQTLYRCDSITRVAELSIRGLSHHVKVTDEMKELLVALALVGAIRGGDYGIYRSGCDLIVTDTLVESIDSRGNSTPINAEDTLEQALQTIADKKHLFAAPHRAVLSKVEVELAASVISNNLTGK